jgi:hypothetical protein
MSGQDTLGQDEIDALMRGVQGHPIDAPPVVHRQSGITPLLEAPGELS